MRFNHRIDIFVETKIPDGQGGFDIQKLYDSTVKANVIELPLEEVQKIYGTSEVNIIKAVLFTKHKKLSKIRWNDIEYDVKRLHIKGNKTYITAEEIDE